MGVREPAYESLSLLPRKRDGKVGDSLRRLPRGKDHLRQATAGGPAEVHPGATPQLDQLGVAELGSSLVDGDLTGSEPGQYVPHAAAILAGHLLGPGA